MKKPDITPIEELGFENKDNLFRIASKIKKEIELKTDNDFSLIYTGSPQKDLDLLDGAMYLAKTRAIEVIALPLNADNSPTKIIGTVNRIILDKTIQRLAQELIGIYREVAPYVLGGQKTPTEMPINTSGIMSNDTTKAGKIELKVMGKYDSIILNGEPILSSLSGGVPASLLKILFENRNGQFRNTDYIIKNTRFTNADHVWDTIKEFRRRLINNKTAKIITGERKQGYKLLLLV